MYEQIINLLTTLLGNRAGKAVAGIAVCFGLGVLSMYALPQYLVTVDVLNAEVTKLVASSRKSDNWQELNLTELRREITQKQLWDIEDKVDDKNGKSTQRILNRMKALSNTLNKLDDRMKEIREDLQQSSGAK